MGADSGLGRSAGSIAAGSVGMALPKSGSQDGLPFILAGIWRMSVTIWGMSGKIFRRFVTSARGDN